VLCFDRLCVSVDFLIGKARRHVQGSEEFSEVEILVNSDFDNMRETLMQPLSNMPQKYNR